MPTGAAAGLEDAVTGGWQELVEVLKAERVEASRRALRLCPGALQWSFGDGTLRLAFTLPAGAYATTVLREILVVDEPERIRA